MRRIDLGRARPGLIIALFLLSGITGLVYEVLWARRLGFVLGNAAHAHAVVLATFMGGLAIGNAWLGGLADRTTRPLRLYGHLELGVALLACLSLPLLTGLSAAYLAVAPGLAPGIQVMAKIVVAAVALLPATILMGGTLPILARYVTRSLAEMRASVAGLYFVNSVGAVAGALLAAFWLIPAFGSAVPIVMAALLNALIGVLAIALGRSEGGEHPPAPPADTPAAPAEAPLYGREARRWLLGAVAVAGGIAMVFETAWIRLLSTVTGGSSASFAVMLAAFIGGIAAGAWVVGRWRRLGDDPLRGFGLAEAGAGLAVLATLPFYERLPYFFIWTAALVQRAPETYLVMEGVKALTCLLLMLPPTLLIGMTLPLASRAAACAADEVGAAVGRVFALNTLGNVVGALGGGLVLLPLLGLRGALEFGALAAVLVGTAVAWTGRPPLRRAAIAAFVVAGFVAYRLLIPAWDASLANAGAFRWNRAVPPTFAAYKASFEGLKIVHHTDDAHATVAVRELPDGNRTLMVNGKPDASSLIGDMTTQVLTGELPALLAPTPRRALVVGLGSGVTAGSMLAHPLARLDVVEISPAVTGTARLFTAWNRGVLDDPRLVMHEDDAFHHLAVSRETYDMIVNVPSNPWLAGIANLFTMEYYALVQRRLAPDGVFVQWLQTYETDDEVVALVLRTAAAAFPYVQLWQAHHGTDVMLVCTTRPLAPDFQALAARMARPDVEADLARLNVRDLPGLLSLQMASDARVRRLAGEGPINTLVHPLLDQIAPVAQFTRKAAVAIWRDDERLSPDGGSAGRLSLPRYLAARGRALSAAEFQRLYALHAPDIGAAEGRNPAIAVLGAWRGAFPADAQPVALLADAYTKLGRHDAAAALGEALVARSPGDLVALLRLADQHAEAYLAHPGLAVAPDASLSRALALYRRALRAPAIDRAPIHGRIAALAAAAGRLEESLAAREAEAAASPPAPRAQALLAAALSAYDAGQSARAAGYARRALESDPGDPRARTLVDALDAPAWRR